MKQENTDYKADDLTKRPPEEVVQPIPEEQLNLEAKLRAKKKRPLIEKIIRLLKREDEPYREIVINVEPFEKRVALLVDGVMQKFEIERPGDESLVGAIFKGKIQNHEPGLKAAFVDIGQPKNAFLHYWDIYPSSTPDNSYEVVRENRSKDKKKAQAKVSAKDTPEKFPIGTEIVVQITKAQIGSKGPRVTTNVAIPGRYLVLMPYAGQCGISRKIEDRRERDRIKKILRTMKIPEDMGVIVRTAGQGKRLAYFERDLLMLLNEWKHIQHRMDTVPAPTILYKEPDIIGRTVRDFLTEQTDRILIDSKEYYDLIIRSVSEVSSRSRSKIQLFKENIPIFERYNIERQIAQTFQRRVPLPSGGEIVIDETEALVAIDVNTGSHKGKNDDGKDFILQANLEAVTEAARQVRLRNLGGLVIIDTIDMKSRRDRQAVYKRLKDEMEKDKAKSQVLPISQLGIMQMTRQRHAQSNSSGIYTTCPYCGGKGIVKSARTMSAEIQRKIVSTCRALRANSNSNAEISLLILLNPENFQRLQTDDYVHLANLEKLYNLKLTFRADPSYHLENFRIQDGSKS